VLIVDDEADIRDSLAEILVLEGYEVVTAENGKDGLAVASRVRPTLILLDLLMPEMDGWAFRAHQRRDPELATIPVVIMSAVDNIRREASALGAEYLVKPVVLATLLNTVERHSRP
jgi:DNA-binding response OmpR family regulator